MLTYLSEPCPWADKIVAIAHNAMAYERHFILNRAILLKWKSELIMNGLKIICMKKENIVFLDSMLFFRVHYENIRGFGQEATNSW